MYSNINRSRMCQGTLGPNGPNRPLARGYAWHTPNIRLEIREHAIKEEYITIFEIIRVILLIRIITSEDLKDLSF